MFLIIKLGSVLETGMAKVKNKLKPINAPIYGYGKALYLSFYSKRLYIDVGKRWRGYGIGYLVLLIALWSIPFSIKMALDLNTLFNEQLTEPLLAIPTIYIQNGEATFDKPMPYLIKNRKNEVVLIVDTTGQVNEFSEKYPKLTILINKDRVSFRMPGLQALGGAAAINNPNKPLVQSFGKGENLVFDGKKIVEQGAFIQWKYAGQLMVYPVITVVFFSMFLMIFLILGFLGQLFTRIFFSFRITVQQSSRLLMVATTPMMLVLLGILISNVMFPGYGFLLMVVLSVYFSLAVYSLKSESKRVVNV
jgi:hypothetical protein